MEKKYIAHFPEENLIWSFGSGYGGNALLGKKCLALRIASTMAKREGWMAEHMLILRLISPEGKRFHLAAAFPSACGKTNLAMLLPTIPGWKCECIGDDIAWMKIGDDGRLYAINPEAGFFGVAPGTSMKSNPMAMRSLDKNCIFTNCALTDEGDIWWEGMDKDCNHAIDWKNNEWTPESETTAAHPNARFTAPAGQCPVICEDWEKTRPACQSIFSSSAAVEREPCRWSPRRSTSTTAFSWAQWPLRKRLPPHWTSAKLCVAIRSPCSRSAATTWPTIGSTGSRWETSSEKTLRPSSTLTGSAPRATGRWLWPGFGDNSRVLKWMCQRVSGEIGAMETPIGNMPAEGDLDLSNLDIPAEDFAELMEVDSEAFKADIADAEAYLAKFGDKVPERLRAQLETLKGRLG